MYGGHNAQGGTKRRSGSEPTATVPVAVGETHETQIYSTAFRYGAVLAIFELAALAGAEHRARPFKRVSYVIPTQVANLAPDDMWDESICLNGNARDDHMTLLCKKPRKENLLCSMCMAGCHAERDCTGSPGHVVPVSRKVFQAEAGANVRVGTYQSQGKVQIMTVSGESWGRHAFLPSAE